MSAVAIASGSVCPTSTIVLVSTGKQLRLPRSGATVADVLSSPVREPHFILSVTRPGLSNYGRCAGTISRNA